MQPEAEDYTDHGVPCTDKLWKLFLSARGGDKMISVIDIEVPSSIPTCYKHLLIRAFHKRQIYIKMVFLTKKIKT